MLCWKNINYYLKYPLMAVMLLWALTLPGQEADVYSFLVRGILKGSNTAPVTKATPLVKERAVQAFLEARTASAVVLHLPQEAHALLPLFAFAAPIHQALPAFAPEAATLSFLARALRSYIHPNAP